MRTTCWKLLNTFPKVSSKQSPHLPVIEFHHLLSISLNSGSLWTVQTSPASLDNGSDSAAMSVIQRHETLSATKRELQQRLGRLEAEVEQSESLLQSLKQEHSIKILVRLARMLDHPVFLSQMPKLSNQSCGCACCRWALSSCQSFRASYRSLKRRIRMQRSNSWWNRACPEKRYALKSKKTVFFSEFRL